MAATAPTQSVKQFITEVHTAGHTNANAIYSSNTASQVKADKSSSSKKDDARQAEPNNSNETGSRSISDAADTNEKKYEPGTGLKSKVSDEQAFDSIKTTGGSELLKPGQIKQNKSKL